jgi:hypothetical protein
MDKNLRKRFEGAKEEGVFNERPPSGHQMRFRAKLLNEHGSPKRRSVLPMWVIGLAAASIILLISSSVIYNIGSANDAATSTRGLSEVSPQMNQVESYFVNQIKERTKNLDLADPEIKSLVIRYSKLEVEYQKLTSVLNRDFENDKVIDAMIDNYKMRLKILEGIKIKMELNQKTKTRNNDTSNA